MALEIVVAVTAIFIPDVLEPVDPNRRRNPKASCSASSRSTASYWLSVKYEMKNHQSFANIERLANFWKTCVANLCQKRKHVLVSQRIIKRAARPTAPNVRWLAQSNF